MTATELVQRIVDIIDLQTAAIAVGDFARIEELTAESASLCAALDQVAAEMPIADRVGLVDILQSAVDQANRLVESASESLGQARLEIQEVRHGQTATNAYRQAVPREAAMSYSRRG